MRDEGGVQALFDAILLAGTPFRRIIHPIARERLAEEATHHGARRSRLPIYAIATAAVLADLVAHDPSIIPRALQEVERRMERASSGERHELEEWAHLLTYYDSAPPPQSPGSSQ